MKKFSIGILVTIMVLAIASTASAHVVSPITRAENLALAAGFEIVSHEHLPENLPIMPIVLLDGQMAMSEVGQYVITLIKRNDGRTPIEVDGSFTADAFQAYDIGLVADSTIHLTISYIVLNGTPRAVQVVGVGCARWAREIPSK